MIIRENGENVLTLTVEEEDDLWYLSNLISPGDHLRMTVMRRVERKQDMNRAKETERKPVTVTIVCESVGFQEFSQNLRVLGTIVEGPEEDIGDHQSLSVSKGDSFDLLSKKFSPEEEKLLEESLNRGIRGRTIFVTMDDEAAEIFISRSYGNQRTARIESGKSGKMYENNYSETSYFRKVMEALENYSGRGYVLIISGEGFTPQKFERFVKETSSGFASVESFSTTRSDEASIYELLSGEGAAKATETLRLAKDTRVVEKFLSLLRKGDLAAYGYDSVRKATEMGAVDTIIVTEDEFRKDQVKDLIRIAQGFRSGIHIISASAEPGKIIRSFGGICATLRYTVQE